MKSYVVGGAVRDRLLGLPVADRDHVVVGATVDELVAAGYQPVGRDFPVFLHPVTHEEYALARTERKVAPGYAGFVFHADPSVTLEADLERRDLTVNAIAEDDETGRLIDPFGGQRDLASRVFRHVGPAFVEDPVRVLRVARFAARFADFTVAPETVALMRTMAAAGEIDALVPERVWQEIARGLMEDHPARMFEVLEEAHALDRLFPELAPHATTASTARALGRVAAAGQAVEVRFAVLTAPVAADWIDALCTRLSVPRAVRDVATLVAGEREALIAAANRSVEADARCIDVMARCDAFRRPARFEQIVEAVAASSDDDALRARLVDRYDRAAAAVRGVDAGAIARAAGPSAAAIVEHLRAARLAALRTG